MSSKIQQVLNLNAVFTYHKNTKRLLILHTWCMVLFVSLGFAKAFGSEVVLNAALGHSNCTLLQFSLGAFELRYTNPEIPPNSDVTLHHGWEEYKRSEGNFVADWQDITEIKMDSVANRTWSVFFEKNLYEFGSNQNPLAGINFVFKITLPNGQYFFDKGNNSRLGFYRASWNFNTLKCFDEELIDFLNFPIANVIRN